MKRFIRSPALTQIRFLQSTTIQKGRTESHVQASNTDTKIYDVQSEILVERSTAEVRTWKESLATESEADVKADRGEIEAGRTWSAEKRESVERGSVADLSKELGSKP